METHTLLQSDTLLLRAPELGDLDFMFHIENDTRLWNVSACKVPYSRYLLQQYIETNQHDIYADKQLRLMVQLRESGQLIGAIDLFDFSPANHRTEVGIVIDQEYRRKGYARKALTLLCHYAEQILDLHQLYAYIFESNAPAQQLFASCGFKQTATLPEWAYIDKKYQSVHLYQHFF